MSPLTPSRVPVINTQELGTRMSRQAGIFFSGYDLKFCLEPRSVLRRPFVGARRENISNLYISIEYTLLSTPT